MYLFWYDFRADKEATTVVIFSQIPVKKDTYGLGVPHSVNLSQVCFTVILLDFSFRKPASRKRRMTTSEYINQSETSYDKRRIH